MATQFDSAASNSGYPPSGISVSHTLGYGSGNKRIVFVAILTVGGTSETISSCTYDGVSMTLLREVSQTYFSRQTWVRVYYLLDSSLPATSGSKTVSVSFSGGGAYYGIVSAISYYGARQIAPPYADTSNNGNPLSGQYSTGITVASESGLLVDFGGVEASGGGVSSQSPGSGQTERLDALYIEIDQVISEKAYSSSGSNSMAQTPDANYAGYGHIVVEVEDDPTAADGVLGSQGYAVSSGTSVSGSYTCHDGTNRKLLVGVGAEAASAINVNSVTYNGTALTKITEVDHSTTYNCVAWFFLDEVDYPGTSGAYTLQANFSTTANPGHMVVIELDEAEQGMPSVYNSSEASTSNTLNTTISTGDDNSWIVGMIVSGETNTFSPTSGQNELVDQQGGGGGCSAALGYEKIDTAGATNMQWQASATVNRLLQVVLAISPYGVLGEYNALMVGSNF